MRNCLLPGILLFVTACGNAQTAPSVASPSSPTKSSQRTPAPSSIANATPASTPPLTSRTPLIFEGNAQVPTSELLAVVQTGKDLPETRTVPPADVLKLDVLKVTAAYYDRGFLTVKADAPRIETAPDGTSAEVHLRIKEGPQYRVGEVAIEERDAKGNVVKPLGEPKSLRSRISFSKGDIFSRSVLVRDLEGVSRIYRDAGFAAVTAEPDMLLNPDHTVDVTIPIRRMDPTLIDKIQIEGNKKVSEAAIRKQLKITEGKLLNQTALEQSKLKLIASGLFRSVDVAVGPKPGTTGRAIVEIKVEEN